MRKDQADRLGDVSVPAPWDGGSVKYYEVVVWAMGGGRASCSEVRISVAGSDEVQALLAISRGVGWRRISM